jgi:hypothetical protein
LAKEVWEKADRLDQERGLELGQAILFGGGRKCYEGNEN